MDRPVPRGLIKGDGFGRLSTVRIGDPVNGSPGSTSSYRDVEISSKRVDRKVGGGEAEIADGLKEGLVIVAFVGVSFRSERREVDPSISPASEEEAVLVVLGKLRVAVDFHPGGRSAVDLIESGGGIEEIRRPIEGALVAREEPSVVSPNPDVKDPTVGIPWELVIPLSVGVEGEEVAVLVEGEVVLVAESVGNDLTLFSIRRDAEDRSLRGVGDGGGGGGDVPFADIGVISAGHVKPSVRTASDSMGAVFSSSSGKLVEKFGVTAREGLTGLGAMQENPLRLNAEEVVSVPEEAVGITGFVEDDLGLVGYAVLVRIEKDLDIPWPGDSHLPVFRDRHGPGVMGEVIAGKLCDLKSLRDTEGVFGMKASDGQQDEKKVTGHADGTVILVFFRGEASLELLFRGNVS